MPARWSSVLNRAANWTRSICRPVARSTSRPWSMACLAARRARAGPVAYRRTRPRAARGGRPLGAAGAGDDAEQDLGLAEPGALPHHPEVGGECQLEPAAE